MVCVRQAGSATAARHAAAARLPALCGRLRFGADTLCLSVSLLDALLSRVRATPRHVACAALACLHLAAKLCEEDEVRRHPPHCTQFQHLRSAGPAPLVI